MRPLDDPDCGLHALQGESAKRSITGADFFRRFPALHGHLLAQLHEAAAGMARGGLAMHPSLYPILVLLARLKPSLHSRTAPGVRERMRGKLMIPSACIIQHVGSLKGPLCMLFRHANRTSLCGAVHATVHF